MTLRARIDRTMVASSSISPVERRSATGSVRSSMRIGRRVRTARAAGRLEPAAVGKSRIASSVAWTSGSPLTAATRRREPSGSTRSITHQSASSGMREDRGGVDRLGQVDQFVEAKGRVGDESGQDRAAPQFELLGLARRLAARFRLPISSCGSTTRWPTFPHTTKLTAARAGALLTHSPSYEIAGCRGPCLAVSLQRRSTALHARDGRSAVVSARARSTR